jgi:hypothetical protein
MVLPVFDVAMPTIVQKILRMQNEVITGLDDLNQKIANCCFNELKTF